MNKCNECGSENIDSSKYCSSCGYKLFKPQIQAEERLDSIQKPVKKVDLKRFAGIIVSVLAFFAAYFLVQQLLFKTPTVDKVMMKMASEFNESCPIMVDRDTRLDNVLALPSGVFQYNYTLINMEKETVDMVGLRAYLEQNILNFVRTNPDLKFQRENKVTMNYYYKDKKGNHLFTISITPEQYK